MLGEIAVYKVCLRAVQKNVIVSRPLGDFGRYDLIIDDGGKLYRCQVKYTTMKPSAAAGSVEVDLRKRNRTGVKLYSDTEIDLLLVYVPEADMICQFGPQDFNGKTSITIRLTPAKNKQSKNTKVALDHTW